MNSCIFSIPSLHSRVRLNHRTLLLILLCLIVCSTSVSAAPYPYGEPKFVATILGDAECTPGTVIPLNISITNIATSPELILDPVNPVASNPDVAYGVMLTLEPGTSPVEIIHTSVTIPVLPPSISVPVVFPVIIPADAQAGTYYLDLRIHSPYADSVSIQGSDSDIFHYTSKNVTLQIPITIKAQVRIRVDNITAVDSVPGQNGKITANLTNIGYLSGKHASAELMTDEMSPVTPYQGSSFLGTFATGETRTVQWRVKIREQIDATTIPATIIISYQDPYGNGTESQPVSVGIPVHTGPKFSISHESSTITPGGSTTVRVTYTNTGDTPAHDAAAKIVPVTPITSTRTGAFLGTIAPGESRETEYEFRLDQKALIKPYGVLTDIKFRGADGSIYLSDPMKIELKTVSPGILAILLSPLAMVVLLGILLILGYLFLKREGRLV